MATAGEGVSAVVALWVLTGFTFAFVLLRLYTRILVTHSYGADDTVYILAFIFFLLSTAFTTKSAHHGFGQNMSDIANPEDAVQAILWELIGQTFSLIGMALAKWSLGLFLLRLVTKAWLKIVIWVAMGCVMSASVSVSFVGWLQCTPYKYLWDRRVTGECHINAVPVSTVLNSATVVVDFLFAGLPWLFIWELQANKQERIVILSTMSLGVLAAACGIKRAAENGGLSDPNYLEATVPLILWSAVELAVTMICIGIAVCRPLYKDFLRNIISTKTAGKNPWLKDPKTYGIHKPSRHVCIGDIEIAPAQGETKVQCCVNKWDRLHTDRKSDEQIILADIHSKSSPSTLDRDVRVTEEMRVTRSE
ncbi:hypothetical protein F5Y11DRAFT_361279 [Daldinia sp. FL1419]|nr:hypothetical protein F5Y11DRAFT_361279 [Daldinia sp. FL1419]